MIAVRHDVNRGYGRALRTGTERASKMDFEYVLFMDSDLTNDPRYLPAFARRMADGYDIIKASRYVAGGAVLGVPRWRCLISIVGNRVASLLYGLGIRDCTNGFRACRTAILLQMHLRENGFAIIMEELYQAKFLARRFCEIPNTLTARTDALRSSSFTYHPLLLLDYLKYPLKAALGWRPRHLGPGSEEEDATRSL
jgi:dolichol-phosphate mannosyltransferase